MLSPGRKPRGTVNEEFIEPPAGATVYSPGRQSAAGSDLRPTAEKEGWWGVCHWPLAGEGESRRPKAVCDPGSAYGFSRTARCSPLYVESMAFWISSNGIVTERSGLGSSCL